MSICFEHEDKMCVLILNEHDPLTKEDGQLFYDTLDGLLTYANDDTKILGDGHGGVDVLLGKPGGGVRLLAGLGFILPLLSGDVFGNIDQHGARPPGNGDTESFADHFS